MLALLAAEAIILVMLMGNSGHALQDAGVPPGLSGTIRIVGSTSMEKLTCALAECFMDKYPDVVVTVQFTGSSVGIEAVSDGSADIGISSRSLRDEEKSGGLVENVVAIDGIAVCVDGANPVTGLGRRELADIYTGKITNWSDLGGVGMPIVVVGREAGSGTRDTFEEALGIRDLCAYANELEGMGTVMARVAATPGAIGYVSFDMIKKEGSTAGRGNVSVLALDGILPTAENVKTGRYPLCQSFYMVTKGDISDQKELLQAWFDFVYSKEGQDLAAAAGLVGVD